jgi:hypothetical protein
MRFGEAGCTLPVPAPTTSRLSGVTSDTAILKGKTHAEQSTWLQDLHQRPNDAVRGGVFHWDEIDTEALPPVSSSIGRFTISTPWTDAPTTAAIR